MKTDTFQLLPNKVTRLRRSLFEDITATLNGEGLDILQKWVPLDADGVELRRLHAALVAEAVRHLLGGRMNRDEALQLGDITLQLLLDQPSEEFT